MNLARPRVFTAGVVVCMVGIGCPSSAPVEGEGRPATARRRSDAELTRRVETYLRPWIQRGDFRGVVRISRGDDVLVNATWGLDGFIDGDARNAAFRIASLTKTFTAGAVLMLADAEALSLDDPLDRFVPGVASGDRITVQDLLAHASGVAPPDDSLYFRESLTLEELVADIAARPLEFEPGSENRYSSAGFNLLARTIEVASGTSYERYLRDAIFEPLGMRNTGHRFGTDSATVVAGMRPGPGPSGVRPAPRIQFAAAFGSGSLASTAADLQRWGLGVARERLFSYEGLMWPFGWGKIEAGGEQGLEQTGAMTGVASSLAVFPESETVVIVLNAVETADWTRWNRALSAIAFGTPIDTPQIPQPAESDADTVRLVGTYRDGDTKIRVEQGDGLELIWGDWPHGRYLMPLGDGSFYSRTSGGYVRFEPDSGPVKGLVQRWGDSTQSFERVRR